MAAWTEAEEAGTLAAWARRFWKAMRPHAADLRGNTAGRLTIRNAIRLADVFNEGFIVPAAQLHKAYLQALYDVLIARGLASGLDALKVGGIIEETDMRDIKAAIERSQKEDIDAVYESLLCGSRNHLRSFARSIRSLTGQPYVAQVLDQAEVDQILESPHGEMRQEGASRQERLQRQVPRLDELKPAPRPTDGLAGVVHCSRPGVIVWSVSKGQRPGTMMTHQVASRHSSGRNGPGQNRRTTVKAAARVSTALLLTLGTGLAWAQGVSLTIEEQLGRSIFFDENLSINRNQSCATCHAPEVGWSGPDSATNAGGAVYEGSYRGRFSDRRPPSSAYATQSPTLHYDKSEDTFVGGNFWDGRATGEALGSPAADQAQGPFLNPLEHGLAAPADVVERVCAATYGGLFRAIWGDSACDLRNADSGYKHVARSVAAFEASPESNAFSSKFDASLQRRAVLSRQERKGRDLFMGKGKCHECHAASGERALFTDYTFDNLGLPRNPENPFYRVDARVNPRGQDWVDPGLGGFLETHPTYRQFAADNMGKHKVPTLRNVAKSSCEAEPADPKCVAKAYGHNGYFKTLKGIVHFYNTRDVKPRCPDAWTSEALALKQNCWPEPEVAANVNAAELGNLGLTPAEEDAIVAFLITLSDGHSGRPTQLRGGGGKF